MESFSSPKRFTSSIKTCSGLSTARLLEIAAGRRASQNAGSEQVVWSALRRAGTLLPRADLDKLRPFLEAGPAIDTRLVALQAVFHVFEAAAPGDCNAAPELIRNRIFTIAKKFLDPDVFLGGENAAIAENAILALAGVADHRLGIALAECKSLGRPWLMNRLRVTLDDLLRSWKMNNPRAEFESSAYQLVAGELTKLS